MLMTTVDEIVMQADADRIFVQAAQVESWPVFLPHYRWVRVLQRTDAEVVVEMAARRGWIPVKWVATQHCDPDNRQIVYHHLQGATQGMRVVWRIQPDEQGGVRVSIVHELTLKLPIIRSFIGKTIVGRFFVKYIAGKTLARMKAVLEGGLCACAVPSSRDLDH